MTRRFGPSSAAIVVAAGLLAAGCGGDDEPPSDNSAMVRRENIINAVVDGHLPPVALMVYPWTQDVEINFIEGPNGDEDIVRTRRFGSRGPKLHWDLDEDGKIERDERTITERDLYEATLKYRERR
jgi:hypothetical protein